MVPDVPARGTTPGTDAPAVPRSGWRRRLRQARWYRRTKLLLKRLAGRDPWLSRDLDVGLESHGDWALTTAGLTPGAIVYALGVGKNLSVEIDLVRRFGVVVHAFDPSPESIRWVALQTLPPGVHFHAFGAAERDGIIRLRAREAESGGAPVMYSAVDPTRTGPSVEAECLSLVSIMNRLGHAGIAVLKMDIEGAEYGVLRGMLADGIRPRQILVEFHHRFPGIGAERTTEAVAGLRAAGYRLVFIADTGRELAFVHRDAEV